MEQKLSKKEKNRKKRNIAKSFYLVLILLILLVTASYTWFSLTMTPRVSDMAITVGAAYGLELAYDYKSEDEAWTQHLNLAEVIPEIAPLKPVTWVNDKQQFYAADIGLDGRIAGITKALSDEENANKNNTNGYYLKTTFYARTGEPVTVSLTPAVVGEDGTEGAGTYVIGTPVWDGQSVVHNDGGNGAEYAIRIGIRITKLDQEGHEIANTKQFYIYEPNCNGHMDSGSDVTETSVTETYSIDGTSPLIPADQLIRQTVSSWSEAYPVQKDVVIKQMGEFITDTELFDLDADEYAKIDLYIWLEGQDIDCNNQIGQEAMIMANIQFSANAGSASGLVPIY